MKQWKKEPSGEHAASPNHRSAPWSDCPADSVQIRWFLALDTAQQGVYLGEQITHYNLEQHLFFLPTETSKSNISIILATELFTN